jgi:hypothetical protein
MGCNAGKTNNSGVWKTLFIVAMIAAAKSTFIIFGDQKHHQLFNRVKKKI